MLTRENVENSLNKVKVYLSFEGGGVELVELDESGKVKIRLTGACSSCPFSQITLQSVVEKILKEDIPEIKEVELVV